MNYKEKIDQLLATQDATNNALAFELVKSQLSLDTRAAILYILNYQIENFWKKETVEWIFKINETQFNCYIYEMRDSYFMESDVDMYCKITHGDKNILQLENLGDFGYNIVPAEINEHSPTLLKFKEVAIKLFSSTLDEWLRNED